MIKVVRLHAGHCPLPASLKPTPSGHHFETARIGERGPSQFMKRAVAGSRPAIGPPGRSNRWKASRRPAGTVHPDPSSARATRPSRVAQPRHEGSVRISPGGVNDAVAVRAPSAQARWPDGGGDRLKWRAAVAVGWSGLCAQRIARRRLIVSMFILGRRGQKRAENS